MRAVAIGLIVSLGGLWLWGYANNIPGHASLIKMPPNTVWWIFDVVPNMEAELGILLMLAGGVIVVVWSRQL